MKCDSISVKYAQNIVARDWGKGLRREVWPNSKVEVFSLQN
jgi:hypothetical protein